MIVHQEEWDKKGKDEKKKERKTGGSRGTYFAHD
jgi:hypothetical protein